VVEVEQDEVFWEEEKRARKKGDDDDGGSGAGGGDAVEFALGTMLSLPFLAHIDFLFVLVVYFLFE
jgi:hypothetical protein